MTPDLLTACVFCGMSLLRTGLPSSPGLSAEFGASYATLERRDDSPTVFHNDASNVTPKFLLIGMGNAKDAAPGLGAGTPAREWFARLAIANSHDEQSQTFRIPDAVVATGSGRYENFEAGARIPLGERDSIEAAVAQRVHKIVDLVNLGGEKFQFSEERDLFAQRVDVSIGWRHRFGNAEVAAAFREIRPEGKYNTAYVYRQGKQWMPGGAVVGRWRHGTLSLGISAEAAATDMDVHEQRMPDFAHVSYSERATLSAGSLFVEKTWGGTDLHFSIGADRSRLPFVAMAVLGEETRYFDAGYRPLSRTKEVVWDLAARHRISPGVHLRAYVRVIQGGETVSLNDPGGALPDVELSVRRGGHFPITQFMLGGGADFSIGKSRADAP
jgi:hypothetical protein